MSVEKISEFSHWALWPTLSLIVLLVSAPTMSMGNDTASATPSILILLADDLGWNDVSYHGSPINTPNIDQIAREGIELDRFYVQPTCTPTRAGLMTGKWPARLGIVRPFRKNEPGGLPLNEKILPQYLAGLGYQTFMVGKWHLGKSAKAYLPTQRGFDHFYGSLTGGIGYWDKVHGGGYDWQRNGVTVREDGYITHLVRDEVLALLDTRDREKPLLMYVAFQAPHTPNEAPAEAVKKYQALSGNRAVHAGMVDEMDQAIGTILSSFKQHGLLDNTLVFFMSDNGGQITPGEDPDTHSALQRLGLILQSVFDGSVPRFPFPGLEFIRHVINDGASDNTPLSGGKGDLAEGGVRVPAAVWWPGHLEEGVHQSPFTITDVLPTLLNAAGATIPTELDGRSQLAALQGEQSETPDYLTSGLLSGQAFYRWPYKLLSDDEVLLFNVMNDPSERVNLADQMPEKVSELLAALSKMELPPPASLPIFDTLFDPDDFGGEEDREPWADSIDQ